MMESVSVSLALSTVFALSTAIIPLISTFRSFVSIFSAVGAGVIVSEGPSRSVMPLLSVVPLLPPVMECAEPSIQGDF
jgi:hypothetical protein